MTSQQSQINEYKAILRCQTWGIWPDKIGFEDQSFFIEYGMPEPQPARLAVICYPRRQDPKKYGNEETYIGPLLSIGQTHGVENGQSYRLHQIGNAVLMAPEDEMQLLLASRSAYFGEVDIHISFSLDSEPSAQLVEALRSTAYATMSLLNLQLRDFLTPAVPFQIIKYALDGTGNLEMSALVACHNRPVLEEEAVKTTLSGVANVLWKSSYGEKLGVALELYAAHFTEQQVRVRFLMLVIAMETLATPTPKHAVVIDLLCRWQQEIAQEMEKCPPASEEFQSLKALYRELGFRSSDSIRSQVRKLFAGLQCSSPAESNELQRTALRIYDKRSTLVHEGSLPIDELKRLEFEARDLLERLFKATIQEATSK